MNNALEVTGLTKHYPGFTLDHISFSLPEGCIMGLIGENGAGKTTALKLILGLARPDEGGIQVLGQSGQDRALREHLGVVMDERICSGTYFANAFSRIKRYLNNPALLEQKYNGDPMPK